MCMIFVELSGSGWKWSEPPSVAQVLKKVATSKKRLGEAVNAGVAVIATQEGSLEGLVSNRYTPLSYRQTADLITTHPEAVVVLPSLRMLDARSGRRERNYRSLGVVDVLARGVVDGAVETTGSQATIENLSLTHPDELLGLAFSNLRSPVVGYRFMGSNVGLDQAIRGAAFLMLDHVSVVATSSSTILSQLQSGKDPHNKWLSRDQKTSLAHLYTHLLLQQEFLTSNGVVSQSQLDNIHEEFIALQAYPHLRPRRGLRPQMVEYWRFAVNTPSGSRDVHVDPLPVQLTEDNPIPGYRFAIGAQERDGVTTHDSEFEFYGGKGRSEKAWEYAAIAAAQKAYWLAHKNIPLRVYDQSTQNNKLVRVTMPSLPFIFPRPALMPLVHGLHERVIGYHKGVFLRPNQATQAQLLSVRLAESFSHNATTSWQVLAKQHSNPLTYAVRIIKPE